MAKRTHRSNLQAIIVSVIVAIFLWFFVVTDVVYFYDIDVPLKVIGLTQNKALVKPIPETVKMRFRGKGQVLIWAYFTMPMSESSVFLDVSKVHRLQEFHLNTYFEQHPDLLVLPRDFDLDFINVVSPETVWVHLEESITRKIPVAPEVDLQAAPGYMIVGGVRYSPDSIDVTGAETLVDQIRVLKTAKLELTDVVNDIFMDLPVKLDTHQPLSYSENKIHVTADVQSIGTREIEDVPIRITNVPAGFRPVAIPDHVTLTIEGGQDVLLTLGPEHFRAIFDFEAHWSPEIRRYSPEIETPNGIQRISSVYPDKVEIILRQ